jgi:hypothetical protein
MPRKTGNLCVMLNLAMYSLIFKIATPAFLKIAFIGLMILIYINTSPVEDETPFVYMTQQINVV